MKSPISSITIGGTEWADAPTAFKDKKITIPWATKDESTTPATFTSLYAQGARIVITYTAKLTSTTNIDAADTNTISITPEVDNGKGNKEPWNESWEDSAEITTYAAAIYKYHTLENNTSEGLAGAQFTIAGLSVEKVSDGVYRVVSYNPESDTASAVLDTDKDGKLYILGLASDVKLTVTEYKAPDGYNKLTGTKTLKPQVLKTSLYEASGTRYYDADGNLISESANAVTKNVTRNLNELDSAALTIENKKGVELPSTGGIGTTMFYVIGAILVLGAGIVLVAKRRMSAR